MKKLLKKSMYLIGFLAALLCVLVLLCAIYPGLAESIAKRIYPGRQSVLIQEPETEGSSFEETDTEETSGEWADESTGEGAEPEEMDIRPVSAGADTYVPPSESAVFAPEEVSGRNGYLPVKESSIEVGQEEAEQIQDTVGPGETGDGLSFDSQYYPYYAMLNDKLQHLYRQIYANAMAVNPVFSPVETVSSAQLKNVFTAVYNDHPELFWLDTAYSCRCLPGGRCIEIRLQFNRTADNLEAARTEFEDGIQALISNAQNGGSAYEKERMVHDALSDRTEYDLRAPMNQSAYSAAVNGRTVCAGYARAFQYAMQKLGIPCYYCTGYAGQSHAWNIVRLEDDYYNVDVTWDDTDPPTYDYFNRTDSDFAGNHVRQDLSVHLPPCNGQKYRGLEALPEDTARDISDLGILPEEVLDSLEDYYADCYERALAGGTGTKQFQNVLQGEALLKEWKAAYDNKSFQRGYAESVLTELGATDFQIRLEVEELAEDRYLISHTVVIR